MLRALCLVAGWLVLAVAVDLGVGIAVEALRPRPDGGTASGAASGAGIATGPCPEGTERSRDSQTRSTHPAYDGAPWMEEWWCEFDRMSQDYMPYLFSRHRGSRQPLIQEADGVRRSYQAPDLTEAAPTVWFFGGSTMWGWGQRDEHTIPSEVARLAQAAGTPLRVVNFGQLAWVHWQGVLAFEQELAERPAPDLVVFYDGVNDVNVQMPMGTALGSDARPSGDPTIYDFDVDPPPPVPGPFDVPAAEPEDDSWSDWWSQHSAIARVGGALGGLFGMQPAFAQDQLGPSEIDEIAARVLDIYERGRVLANGTARRHGVQPLYVWQPRRTSGPQADVDAGVRRELESPVVDLSAAFRGHDPDTLYTDDAHTNELGAALVAEALWPHLREALSDRAEADG